MQGSKSNNTSILPRSLKEQLDGLRVKLRLSEGSKALSTALGALIVSWFIVFGSDRLWDTPQPLLMFFSLTGWAAAIWVLALGYRLAIAQPSCSIITSTSVYLGKTIAHIKNLVYMVCHITV